MARNPFDEIERAFDRMGKQLEQFGPETFTENVLVDVEDRGDEYVVTADLPGFDREDIDVELSERTLELSASRAEEQEESGTDYLRRERRRTSARRSVYLPQEVVAAETRASYDNGVLTVTLPKREPDEEDGTNIPVN